MEQVFQAQGKLLLTGEYFVLDGAIALAVPTKKGQCMTVAGHPLSPYLHWKSLDPAGQEWLEGIWDPEEHRWVSVSAPEKAGYLERLLLYAEQEVGIDLAGYDVVTRLEFTAEWGLGSSSTLVSLLAQWWRLDPYSLLRNSFGGSGYDIACATARQPVLYQLSGLAPKVEPADFHPSFSDQLYFLYLGQKQDSRQGIQHYRNIQEDKSQWVGEISDITGKLLRCSDFDEMEYLLMLHEAIVSRVLNLEKVKSRLFPDYWGAVKSLGAWGGDFVLVTSEEPFEEVKDYFAGLGYSTLIPYREMVLS